jgi:diaminopimelate epimerase
MESSLPFIKMHGLGNDFVVLDDRPGTLSIGPAEARAIGDRHRGVGFDQLLILERPTRQDADVFMRIRNTDGSEAGACGNGTRCVAALVMDETGADRIAIETIAGRLDAMRAPDGRIAVDMGPARLDWRDIPLAEPRDTLHGGLDLGPLADPAFTNMGNPHATFFVEDVAAIDLAELGPALEHDPLFPDRANIGIAQVLSPGRLRLRVWERGVGITLACGSGACAAMVAAARRGLTGRAATIIVDGGELGLEWRADGHVVMTGPAATSYSGRLDPSVLNRAA